MHWNERISYYVYTANELQARAGQASKHGYFKTFEEAMEYAQADLRSVTAIAERKTVKICIERHAEFHDGYHNEWCIDWKTDGGRQKVWEFNV